MEDGSNEWRFNKKFGKKKEEIVTVRHASEMLVNSVNHDDDDERPVINLCRGDPSPFPSFQTAATAVDAVAAALRSARFNGYGPRGFGILPAKKAVAEHISKDLPYKLSPDDIYLTVGCKQAIQAIFSALAHSDANILMPKPGFSMYDAAATYSGVELRCYNLLPLINHKIPVGARAPISYTLHPPLYVENPSPTNGKNHGPDFHELDKIHYGRQI